MFASKLLGKMSANAHYSDDFNRANTTSGWGANWTWAVGGDMGISSNEGYPATSNSDSYVLWSTPMTGDNMALQVTATGVAWNIDFVLGAASDWAWTGTYADCGFIGVTTGAPYHNQIRIYSHNGLQTSVAYTLQAADVCVFQRVGNVYTALVNGASKLTWTDTDNTVTRDASHRYVGIGGYRSATYGSCYWDNWRADNI